MNETDVRHKNEIDARIAFVERSCRRDGFHRVRAVEVDPKETVFKEQIARCIICGCTGESYWAARNLLAEHSVDANGTLPPGGSVI